MTSPRSSSCRSWRTDWTEYGRQQCVVQDEVEDEVQIEIGLVKSYLIIIGQIFFYKKYREDCDDIYIYVI